MRKKIIQILTLLLNLSVSNLLSQTGFSMGDNGTLLRTTNGGTSWALQNMGTTQTLWSQWFIDETTGWIVGGSYIGGAVIFKTTNGGNNWVQQDPIVSNWLTSAYFLNSMTGWISGSGGKIL